MKAGTWIAVGAAVLVAFGVGWIVRGGPAPAAVPGDGAPPKGASVWTCSMHPQVRLPAAGKCPICGMPLIPADASGAAGSPLKLSDAARAMAGVETAPVVRRKLARDLQTVGKVSFNETGLSTVVARVDGYVERLFADYVGMAVGRGDHLAELYSPELIVAQRELLMALDDPAGASRLESARLKLRRWDLTDAQVAEIEKSRKIQERITLYSRVRGTVMEKNVVEKSPVKAGDVLYRLASLESVWVTLDVYEYEISWVQYGQSVEIRAEAYPGQAFTGMVTFISPTLSEETRAIRVRVNVPNPEGRLKPGMFVSAKIQVRLQADGRPAPTGLEGKWSCPMHPEVVTDAAGACPQCGMPLVQMPGRPAPGAAVYTCPMHTEIRQEKPGLCPKCGGMELEKEIVPTGEDLLAVPASAVLDSGTRKIVYVETAPGEYLPMEPVLGPRAGDYYPVLSGLSEGDKVAVRGNFLLDSQFQIQGRPSLLNPPAPPKD